MIKNIILDMGKVVNKFEVENMLAPYCDSEQEKAQIKAALFTSKEWLYADEGLLNEQGLLNAMLDKLPKELWDKATKVFENWDKYMEENDGVRDFIISQKALGRKIYLLSNASIRLEKYYEEMSIFRFFEGYVVSAREGLLKPDKRIYLRLLEKFSLKAQECFFIDDLSVNIEAAKQLGFMAQLFEGDFKKINIPM